MPAHPLMVAAGVALALALPGSVTAQTFPSKPLRLVVPFVPGGSTDLIARIMAQKLTDIFGQSFVVDNRPSSGGNIAGELLARAQPDGYTIGYGAFPLATNPSLLAHVPYDVNKDFRMVIFTNISPNIIAITPALPVNSMQDLIAYAKRNPDQLLFGSSGVGSTMHLSMELLKQMTQTQMVHVQYKGMAQVITEIIGGRLQLASDNVTSMLPHVKSGRVRAISIMADKRHPFLPEVSTMAEQGYKDFTLGNWVGIETPTGTPRFIIDKMHNEVARIMKQPDVVEKVVQQGFDVAVSGPEEFGKRIKSEIAKWAKVIRAAGMAPQ